jgi:hypothetical protein
MDERIEKAFETANYMATLSNQKRIIKEEFEQQLTFYSNGGTFQITPQLLSYIKTLIDIGELSNTVLIDSNSIPVFIDDVQDFFTNISKQYFQASKEYFEKYSDIKVKRKIKDLVEL